MPGGYLYRVRKKDKNAVLTLEVIGGTSDSLGTLFRRLFKWFSECSVSAQPKKA